MNIMDTENSEVPESNLAAPAVEKDIPANSLVLNPQVEIIGHIGPVADPAIVDSATPAVIVLPSDILKGLQDHAQAFTRFAAGNAIAFLDLADLETNETVNNLRGKSESDIHEMLQIANSFLVLAYWYADTTDDVALKEAVGVYGAKMREIDSRLGIRSKF